MKGIPAFRLNRLKRAAVLMGAGALVASAAVLGGIGTAHAGVNPSTILGNGAGTLTVAPTSGATSANVTITSNACPSSNQGSAKVLIVDPMDSTDTSLLAGVVNSVATQFSITVTGSFSLANQESLVNNLNGNTAEVVIQCFSQASGLGSGAYEQDAFLSFSTDGSTFTVVPPPAVAATTTVTLQASSPDYAGQPITLTATVAASDHSTPSGTVTFESGGTALPVTTTPASGPNPATTSNGSASFVAEFAAAGTESLTAVFTSSNTGSWGNSTSTTLSLNVVTAPTFSGTIPLSVTVPTEGAFTLTVTPTPVALTPDSTGLNATGTIPNGQIQVSDTRNTFPGWSVSGQDGTWTGSGSAAGGTFPGSQLGWHPTGGTVAQNVVIAGPVTAAAPGLGSATVLASVVHGLQNGFGPSNLGAGLTLIIPPNEPAGPYSNSLTITAVNTN